MDSAGGTVWRENKIGCIGKSEDGLDVFGG